MRTNPLQSVKVLLFWLRDHLTPRQFILLSSVIVGISAALAVIVLKVFAHQIYLFARQLNQTTHLQFITFLLPIFGIVLTVFIVDRVLKGKLEKGTWQIIYAITKKSSIMPRVQMYAQIITSSVTVGFGGSAGLESPVTVTGAAFGSNYAKAYRLSAKERRLLLACGVAAGVSAAFNAPIAGVLFALEVLLSDVGITAFIPLMLASATGSLVSGIILSDKILLSFHSMEVFDFANIPFYIALGTMTGFISVYHAKLFVRIESFFEEVKWRKYTRAIIGGVMLSLLIVLFPALFGEGYESIRTLSFDHPEQLLQHSLFDPVKGNQWVLFAFVGLALLIKPLATAITLGSGGNGGNFAPSLFVGGYSGFIFAYGLNLTGLFKTLPVTNFTMVGMAGVLSGLFHAPLTGMFLIAEITGGYALMIPLMIVSSISFAISKRFNAQSLDTLKMTEVGRVTFTDKDKHILSTIIPGEILEKAAVALEPDNSVRDLFHTLETSKQALFPVVTPEGHLLGIVYLDDLHRFLHIYTTEPGRRLETLMEPLRFFASPDNTMETVMEMFDRSGQSCLAVVSNSQVTGYYSKAKLLQAYRDRIVENTVE